MADGESRAQRPGRSARRALGAQLRSRGVNGAAAIDVAAGNLGGDRLPELPELDGTNPEQLEVYLNLGVLSRDLQQQ